MKISILTDNRTKKRGFLAEHGLSIYIETEKANILFDTGQSDVYCRNALKMDVDLNKTDFIILSHGHYDHCGGLIHFPQAKKMPKIYVQKTAFNQKYKLNPDGQTLSEIGIPWSLQNYSNIRNSLIPVEKEAQIAPNFNLYAQIPNSVAFEGEPHGFYAEDKKEIVTDMLKDEQMLILEQDEGLIVFLGCSHVGVISCLNYALANFGGKKIDTLVAGMHLDETEPLRLKLTIQKMLELDLKRIIPLHCTGIFAIAEMKHLLGSRCFPLCAGDSLEI